MSAFRVFLALPILTVHTMMRDDLCTSHLGHCLAKGGVQRVVELSIFGTCVCVGVGGGWGGDFVPICIIIPVVLLASQ